LSFPDQYALALYREILPGLEHARRRLDEEIAQLKRIIADITARMEGAVSGLPKSRGRPPKNQQSQIGTADVMASMSPTPTPPKRQYGPSNPHWTQKLTPQERAAWQAKIHKGRRKEIDSSRTAEAVRRMNKARLAKLAEQRKAREAKAQVALGQ
jgi:hypothetical protein